MCDAWACSWRMRDLSPTDGQAIVEDLNKLPELVEKFCNKGEQIKNLRLSIPRQNTSFSGSAKSLPSCTRRCFEVERDISYAHAEGYPAAELKHGPIALLIQNVLLFLLLKGLSSSAKTIANMQEVKARKGPVLAIAPEAVEIPPEAADDMFSYS